MGEYYTDILIHMNHVILVGSLETFDGPFVTSHLLSANTLGEYGEVSRS